MLPVTVETGMTVTSLMAATAEASASPSPLPPASAAGISLQSAMPYLTMAIGFISVINNGLVLVVIIQSTVLKKRLENTLLFNQSLADGVVGCLLILRPTTTLVTYYTGVGGELLCRVWMPGLMLYALFQVSICNLTVITIDRYFEIVHPIKHKLHQSRCLVWLMALFPWLFGLLFSVPFAILPNGISQGQCRYFNPWPNPTAQATLSVVNLLVKYFIPLAIFAFCYWRMMISLKKKSVVVAPYTSRSNLTPPTLVIDKARQNIFKILLYIVTTHVLCWSLNQVIYMASMFGAVVDRTGVAYNMGLIVVYISYCINPIIYLAFYAVFKQEFKKVFKRKC